ncbi:MAG: hypothetical protein JWQ54_5516, partial [Mucilaginibacter sp.]|nr:hypothetical protein [Mucilaginibacter sp.]
MSKLNDNLHQKKTALIVVDVQ